METTPAPTPAPVDCAVSQFGAWSACTTTMVDPLCTGGASRTCGNGVLTRSRSIVTPPQGNGRTCPLLEEQATCATQCSVDCVEGAWSQWSACTAACGGGKASRTRFIDVAAQFCGRVCVSTSEEQPCNAQTCAPTTAPIDCVVSAFSVGETERCSVPACGGGTVTARATVLTPAQGAGKACPPLEQQQSCNTAACPAIDNVASGVRWRLVSSDPFEAFVWQVFRSKLAHYLAIDENRLLVNSVMSGSTVVEVTILNAVGDAARNYVDQLQRVAGNTSSGLNIVTSAEVNVGTGVLEPTPTVSDETTTIIIIAVVASVVGVLLISLIVVCAVKRSRKAKASANTLTEMTTTRDAENKSERAERESHYHSAAPLAAHVQSSTQSESDSQTKDGQTKSNQSSASSSAPYHRPPASTTVDLQQGPKTSHNVSKRKSKRKEKQASGSLERKGEPPSGSLGRKDEPPSGSLGHKTLRTAAAEVLHIPIEEIKMGKELGAGSFGVVYKGKWHGNTIAVKQVKTSTAAGGKAAFAEFEAEVSKRGRLRALCWSVPTRKYLLSSLQYTSRATRTKYRFESSNRRNVHTLSRPQSTRWSSQY